MFRAGGAAVWGQPTSPKYRQQRCNTVLFYPRAWLMPDSKAEAWMELLRLRVGDTATGAWKASADVILDKVRRCKELAETGD